MHITRLLDRPARVYAALVIGGIVCFALGGIDGAEPKDGSPREHDLAYNIAGVAWTLLMVVVLALVVYTVALVWHRTRRGPARA
jgi:hypothetical protein